MPGAPSRRGKWLTNFKKSLPAAGNRFPTSKSHFPWREIVFQLQKVISRGGKREWRSDGFLRREGMLFPVALGQYIFRLDRDLPRYGVKIRYFCSRRTRMNDPPSYEDEPPQSPNYPSLHADRPTFRLPTIGKGLHRLRYRGRRRGTNDLSRKHRTLVRHPTRFGQGRHLGQVPLQAPPAGLSGFLSPAPEEPVDQLRHRLYRDDHLHHRRQELRHLVHRRGLRQLHGH